MWQEKENYLYKEFVFDNFQHAFDFMKRVAEIAEEIQHHPKWSNEWNKVKIWLTTHEDNSVTDKDRKMADLIDSIYGFIK